MPQCIVSCIVKKTSLIPFMCSILFKLQLSSAYNIGRLLFSSSLPLTINIAKIIIYSKETRKFVSLKLIKIKYVEFKKCMLHVKLTVNCS